MALFGLFTVTIVAMLLFAWQRGRVRLAIFAMWTVAALFAMGLRI